MIAEIAGRIAAIIAGGYGNDIRRAAVELGIVDADLRTLLGRSGPLKGEVLTEILSRIVRRFGVDPGWLVTGRYDVRSHVAAEENRADMAGLRAQIRQLLKGSERLVDIERVPRADLRLDDDDNVSPDRPRVRQTGDERER
jgi:hypothetical protein